MVFFSDAVFAIAMTLLVLDIPRPGPHENVAQFLGTYDPGKFFAYFVSFWVIALFWFGHHRLFRYVHRYDQGLVVINLMVLFCIAFIPYPSAILGEHGSDTTATVFYAASIAVAAFASASLTWWTVVHRQLAGPLEPAMAWYYVSRGLVVTAVFLLSIPVAFFSPRAAQILWMGSFILQWIGRRYAERRSGAVVYP